MSQKTPNDENKRGKVSSNRTWVPRRRIGTLQTYAAHCYVGNPETKEIDKIPVKKIELK